MQYPLACEYNIIFTNNKHLEGTIQAFYIIFCWPQALRVKFITVSKD